MKREYLMLAHPYSPKKHQVNGYFLSEKIDGQRAFWDGGTSRGLPKEEVPYANCHKDRFIEQQFSTGLWSRNGNVIVAPDWWLDSLPPCSIDGELWNGERTSGNRQAIMSTIKQLHPDERWETIWLYAFDTPSLSFLSPGSFRVSGGGELKYSEESAEWARQKAEERKVAWPSVPILFRDVVTFLENTFLTYPSPNFRILTLKQLPLPTLSEKEALSWMEMELKDVLGKGGEGVMLRAPLSTWEQERSHFLLKVKKPSVGRGQVVGYTTGRVTEKGSRLLGKMGALVLKLKSGRRLELSGFSDEQRTLDSMVAEAWATCHPEEELPSCHAAREFPRGTWIHFKYRGLSRDGIPQEARFLKKEERE